jgi:hypothetical protein
MPDCGPAAGLAFFTAFLAVTLTPGRLIDALLDARLQHTPFKAAGLLLLARLQLQLFSPWRVRSLLVFL